jgi:hypothetical protein
METNNDVKEEIKKEESNNIKNELKEDLTTSSKEVKTIFERPIAKGLIIRFLFLILAFTAFSGQVDKLCTNAMRPVWEYDQEFLNKSLLHSSGYMAALAVPKAILATAETIVLEPSGATFKLGEIKVGELIGPFKDIIDDLWDYMGLVIILIIVQIAIIKLVGLISLKIFLGIGAALCFIQYQKGSIFGKLGYSFIIMAVVAYLVFPLVLYMGAEAYENHQVKKSIEFSENLGVLQEKASDIELSPSLSNMKQAVKTLSQSVRAVWNLALDFFIGAILMFVLIPLFTLGMIIFIIRQALSYLDMPEESAALNTGTKKVLSRVGRRTGTRLSWR